MAKKSTNGNSVTASADVSSDGRAEPDVPARKKSLDTCMKVLAGVQEQIRFADTKAAFLFGINTLMFGFLAVGTATLKKALALPTIPASVWVVLGSMIVFGVCAVIAVGILIYTVMSRFGKLAPTSRCFFGHIATTYRKDYAKYVDEIRAMTEDDWLGEVSTQIVETSHIALSKHSAVKMAAIVTIVGLANWVVAVFATAFLP